MMAIPMAGPLSARWSRERGPRVPSITVMVATNGLAVLVVNAIVMCGRRHPAKPVELAVLAQK